MYLLLRRRVAVMCMSALCLTACYCTHDTHGAQLLAFEQQVLWDRRLPTEARLMLQRSLYLANTGDKPIHVEARVSVDSAEINSLDLETLFPLLADWGPAEIAGQAVTVAQAPELLPGSDATGTQPTLLWSADIPAHTTTVFRYSCVYAPDMVFCSASLLPWVEVVSQLERTSTLISLSLELKNATPQDLHAVQVACFFPYATIDALTGTSTDIVRLFPVASSSFPSVLMDSIGMDGAFATAKGAYVTGPSFHIPGLETMTYSAQFALSEIPGARGCLYPFIVLQFGSPVLAPHVGPFSVQSAKGSADDVQWLGGEFYCNLGLPLGQSLCYYP
jgi:hypothetical protein